MSKLEEEEVLFAYIAIASHAVSLVLVRVDDGMQILVYYVSIYYMWQRFAIYHWSGPSW